jgi:hypothetical protein
MNAPTIADDDGLIAMETTISPNYPNPTPSVVKAVVETSKNNKPCVIKLLKQNTNTPQN